METFSIKQKQAINSLPDFRNFGVILRILLGINLLGDALRDRLDPRMRNIA